MRKLVELPLVPFDNITAGIDLLKKHLRNNTTIVGLADVDVDGVQSMYIMKRFLDYSLRGVEKNLIYTINQGKEHGLQDWLVAEINNGTVQNAWDLNKRNEKVKVDLLIIVDSSMKEVERIKKLHCDVLVLDHHSVGEYPLVGETACGQYVLLNPKTSAKDCGEEWHWTDGFSGGLVVYEFLRHIDPELMVNLKLYQTAVMTLYSDVIPVILSNSKMYVMETLLKSAMEPQIFSFIQSANCFEKQITKNNFLFSINPLINKAIRLNKNREVLDICLNRPGDLGKLKSYSVELQKQVDARLGREMMYGEHIVYYIEEMEENKGSTLMLNIKGVIASRLTNQYSRMAFVGAKDSEGNFHLSFRGNQAGYNYLKLIQNFIHDKEPDAEVGGHKVSFGMCIKQETFSELLVYLENYFGEREKMQLPINSYTLGNMPSSVEGGEPLNKLCREHKVSAEEVLRQIGIYNCKNTSDMEKIIYVNPKDDTILKWRGERGKIQEYSFLGKRAVAFKKLDTNHLVRVYAEQGVSRTEVYLDTTIYEL